jgi:hypothetical protein
MSNNKNSLAIRPVVNIDPAMAAHYEEGKRLIAECVACGSIAPRWLRNFVSILDGRRPVDVEH